MHRLLVKGVRPEGDLTILRGAEARYLTKILRTRRGEKVLLFDGKGREYLGEVERISKEEVSVRIVRASSRGGESNLEIILVQGIPKSAKMDLIVRGTTELGVSSIWPFFSSRTIPKWERETVLRKVSHWQKVATEAARQSGRTKVPEVREPLCFNHMVKEVGNLSDGFLKIVFWEDEEVRSIKAILRGKTGPEGVCFFVGPEGGFSLDEVDLLKKRGCISARLGKRVLRTETAGMAVLGILQYEWGDLG